MRIPRIHLPRALAAGDAIEFQGSAANHLRVLRLRTGDPLVVFDGAGTSHAASVAFVERRRAGIHVGEPVTEDGESPLAVTLAQGVSKGDRMDWSIQKAVELGVAAIAPVIAARSVLRDQPDRLTRKRDHWQAVAVSACEQCGRNVVPSVAEPVPLAACLPALPDALRVFLDPEAGASVTSLAQAPPPACTLLVGPEGGFTDDEIVTARDQGFRGIRLGPRVLRTETAGVAALAALQTLWGDFQ